MRNENQRSFQDVQSRQKKNASKTLKLSHCVTYEYFSPENSGLHLCWCQQEKKKVLPSTTTESLYINLHFVSLNVPCLVNELCRKKREGERNGEISIFDLCLWHSGRLAVKPPLETEIWSRRNKLRFTLSSPAKLHQQLFLLALISVVYKRNLSEEFLLCSYVMCGLDKFTRNSNAEKSFLHFCFILIEYEVMWGESCWCLSSFLIVILT